MLQSRLYYFFTGFILVVWLVSSQANAQGVIDNFNRPNQDTPPAGWTAFRGEWGISEGSLAGESSEADGNQLREAWIWAGDPPVEMPSTMGLSFDMNFLTGPNTEDGVGRHAGVMFCSTSSTHRWDEEAGTSGYCLDWTDRPKDRGVRLLRIDGGDQQLLGNVAELRGPPLNWRVTVDATTIRVWGDDQLIMEVADSRYRGGYFGFWVWSNGTRVEYDNVVTDGITLLPPEEPREVRLQPGVEGRDSAPYFFRAHRDAGAPGNSIVFSLEGQEGDENVLLMAWGRIPTPRDYDLAADVRGQASQRLVIPFARDDFAYILPWALGGGANGDGDNSITLRGELPGLFLDELSVNSGTRPVPGTSNRIVTSVFGGGFTRETSFVFTGGEGAGIAVVESLFVSSSHVLLTLELSGRTLSGSYGLQAGNGAAESAQLPDAFQVEEEGNPGVLDVRLVAAGRVRPYRPRPLQVLYENTGGDSLRPRLLRIHPPPGVKLRLESDPEFSDEGDPVDLLTVNPAGYPGLLPPGASGGKNLIYLITTILGEEIEFTVEELAPLPADPLCLEPANCNAVTFAKPVSVPVAAWAELANVLGSTLEEGIEALGEISLRLALRGRDPASVQEALRLAVHTAWTQVDSAHPSAAVSGLLRNSQGEPLGGVRVAAVRGGERGCGQTLPSGFFVIEGLRGGPAEGPPWNPAAYQLEVEGYEVTAELAVAPGAEGSFGNVVTGAASPAPFAGCQDPGSPLQVDTPGLSSERYIPAGRRNVEVITPEDPNYKTGPSGQSQGQLDPDGPGPEPEQTVEIILEPQHRIDGVTMVYEVTFQNAPGAFPAQSVNVLDELPADLDPSSLRFLGVGVDYQFHCTDTTSGTFTVGNQPTCSLGYYNLNNSSTYQNFRFPMDLNPDIYVNVDCTRDGNELKWEFTSLTWQGGSLQPIELDPAMDEDGFLVGHVENTPEGEAFVQFAVDLAPGSRDPGTLIRNKARVEFLDLQPQGGGGGAGNAPPTWFLDTNYANHLIGRESDWPGGCSGGLDEDLDGLVDCADPDCASAENCQPGGVAFVRGDANSDATINLTDGVVLLLYLFGNGQLACKDAADTNDSGTLEITDAIIIFGWLFGGNGPDPAPPTPTSPGYLVSDCGPDPEPADGLDCLQLSPTCQ